MAADGTTASRRSLSWTTAAALALLACSGEHLGPDQPSDAASGGSSANGGAAGSPGGTGAGLRGFAGSGVGSGGSGVAVDAPPARGGPPIPGLDGPVVSADKPPVPISGGTLLVTADGKLAVAADPERDLVSIVRLADGQVTNVALEPHDEPGRLAQDGPGRVHVALRGSGKLLTLALPSGEILARRAVCGNPRGVAVDPGAGVVHVACAEGRLVSVAADPAGGVARTVTLEGDLRDVVVGGDRLFVSRFRSAELIVLGRDGAVHSRVRPDSQPAFDGFAGTTNPPPGFGPRSPAVAWRLAARADGAPVMLHEEGQDSEIEVTEGGYTGKCAGIVSPALTTFAPDGTAATRTDLRLAQAGLAVDFAVSPGGTFVAVAAVPRPFGGTEPVSFLPQTGTNPTNAMDSCTPPLSQPPSDDNGAAPETTGELPEPQKYAAPPTDASIVAVAFDKRGNLLAQTREPARLLVLTQRRDPIVLSTVSREDTGHRVFHAVTAGGVACASCHPEGGDDGRVWSFKGIGERRTQTVRGGITQTAPFHWDGDMTDLGTLMKNVFVGRMAGPPLAPDQVGALGKFLDAIPSLAPPRAAEDPAAVRGKALFASAGCETCHAGPALTNNTTVDVGTGKPLQVPTLRGISHRLPLMHTGCAKTLVQRFDPSCGGGDRHGVTSSLGPAQIADLVAYLETL